MEMYYWPCHASPPGNFNGMKMFPPHWSRRCRYVGREARAALASLSTHGSAVAAVIPMLPLQSLHLRFENRQALSGAKCDRLKTAVVMDTVPVEKENAAGNVAAPSKAKSIVKGSSQDGPTSRIPLRAVATKPQQPVVVRAVSTANKRMLDRQPTANIAPAAQQGELTP